MSWLLICVGHVLLICPWTLKQMRVLANALEGVSVASGSAVDGLGEGNFALLIWMIWTHIGMSVRTVRLGSKIARSDALAALSIPGMQTQPVGGV